jgi:chromosome segregation ATPase
MGLVASQARLLCITARLSDLELKGQFINQTRMQLSALTSQLFTAVTNLDPDGKSAKLIQARIQKLQEVDKILEIQLKQVDTQHQAAQTELEAVQKVIDKNIERSFKTFAR